MTPDELREEIARLKGWEDLEWRYVSGTINLWGFLPGHGFGVVPSWTTDIAAAWDLLEEMLRAGCSITLDYDHANGGVFVAFEFEDELGLEWKGDYEPAPLAICRAWVAWKRSVVSGRAGGEERLPD